MWQVMTGARARGVSWGPSIPKTQAQGLLVCRTISAVCSSLLCTTALDSWFGVKPASPRPKRDSHCLAAGLEVGDISLLAPSCAGTACTFSQRSISMSLLTLPVELSSLQRGSSASFSYLKVRAQKYMTILYLLRKYFIPCCKMTSCFCSRWKSVLRILPSGTFSAENSKSKPPIGSGFSGIS